MQPRSVRGRGPAPAMLTTSESVPAAGPSRSEVVPRDGITRSSSWMNSGSVRPDRPGSARALRRGNGMPIQSFIEAAAGAARLSNSSAREVDGEFGSVPRVKRLHRDENNMDRASGEWSVREKVYRHRSQRRRARSDTKSEPCRRGNAHPVVRRVSSSYRTSYLAIVRRVSEYRPRRGRRNAALFRRVGLVLYAKKFGRFGAEGAEVRHSSAGGLSSRQRLGSNTCGLCLDRRVSNGPWPRKTNPMRCRPCRSPSPDSWHRVKLEMHQTR